MNEEIKVKTRRDYKKGGQYNMPERRQLVADYLNQPVEERLPLKSFLKMHRMTRPGFSRLEGEARMVMRLQTKEVKAQHLAELRATVDDAWLRAEGKEPPRRLPNKREIKEITEDEKIALGRRVFSDAMRAGATTKDKDLAVRMLGMLTEKKEITHKIDGSFIAQGIIEARRELEQEGYRVAEMPAERPLLHQEVCLPSGQSETEDSSI